MFENPIHFLTLCTAALPLFTRGLNAPFKCLSLSGFKPSLLWLVSSRRSEQGLSTFFLHYFRKCFWNHSRAGGVAEGGGCIIVTSQRNESPVSPFKGTVSEYRLCAFSPWIYCMILSQYSRLKYGLRYFLDT